MTTPNIEAFYAERPARKLSPEVDYGVHWCGDERGIRWPWPPYRVSFVVDTGEVYAICLAGLDSDQVEVIGHASSREDCEERLTGWSDEWLRPVSWARERLATQPEEKQ